MSNKKRNVLFILLGIAHIAIAQGTWTQKADFGGAPRMGCSGFSIGTKGYICSSDSINNFWEYDPTTNVWTIKSSLNAGGNFFVTFSIGNKGYLGGIYNSQDFWEWDQATDVWTQKANFAGPPRLGAVGFSIATKGYIATGADYSTGNLYNDVWEYDQTTNTWLQKSNFAGQAREIAVAFVIGNKGYIGTGIGAGFHQDFWEYNPTTDSWTQKANLSGVARSEAAGFSLGNYGYLGIGTFSIGTGASSDFWKYDVLTNTWMAAASFLGGPRECATSFSIGSKGYLGMGWVNDNPSSYKNDFWEFVPDTTNASAIHELQIENAISVYPNPFSESTTLKIDAYLLNATLRIYNSSGQLVKQMRNIKGNEILVMRDNLSAGIYWTVLLEGDQIIGKSKILIIEGYKE